MNEVTCKVAVTCICPLPPTQHQIPTSPSVAIDMPMARELLPGMGEQTLKDEVKMGELSTNQFCFFPTQVKKLRSLD